MKINEKYTLITGACEGLGKAFALECASRGMNLILVDLPNHHLYNLSDFIERNFTVKIIQYELDLTNEISYHQLILDIEKLALNVNIIINNVGLGGTKMFKDADPVFYEKEILLNIMSTTIISRLFINMLSKNSPSYILNVGSLASFFHMPRKQVYAASKSFVYSFSRSLHSELKNNGIHVSVVCPGGINTNIPVTLLNKTGSWISRMSIMNPEDVASYTIEQMLKGKEVIIPGKLNKAFLLVSKILPDPLARFLANNHMNHMKPDHPMLKYL
ncbi:MAG: SDR family NAD(P)-dependent oxidoreductase [Chitinophagaceae bacterium]